MIILLHGWWRMPVLLQVAFIDYIMCSALDSEFSSYIACLHQFVIMFIGMCIKPTATVNTLTEVSKPEPRMLSLLP